MRTDQSEEAIEALWAKAELAELNAQYAELAVIWKDLAGLGNWPLYAHIGRLYERGAPNFPRNMKEALDWYRKSVFECDDPLAHVGLGRAYYFGDEVTRDLKTSIVHFESAARKGDPEGHLYLGRLSYRGHGVQRNLNTAEAHFTAAAIAGFYAAQIFLARIAFDRREYMSGMKYFFKGAVAGFKLLKANPDDPRLLGVKLR